MDTTQSSQAKQTAKPEEAPVSDQQSRLNKAEAIIRRNVYWALGAGVIPFPVVDVLAVTAVQVKLLKELSTLYGAKFSDHIARKLIGSLLAGIGGVGIGGLVGGSLAKIVPFIGTTLGFISTPVLAGAITHAVGKVTLMHLESGGTLLDFDPVAMRTYFKQEFEKAKETVSQLQKDMQSKTPGKSA